VRCMCAPHTALHRPPGSWGLKCSSGCAAGDNAACGVRNCTGTMSRRLGAFVGARRGRTVQRSLQAFLARHAWSPLIWRAFYCIHVFVAPALMRRTWEQSRQIRTESGTAKRRRRSTGSSIVRPRTSQRIARPAAAATALYLRHAMLARISCAHRSPAISSQRARSAQGRHTPRPKAAAAAASSIELRGRLGCSKQRARSPHSVSP
jgi:hypothetical protein